MVSSVLFLVVQHVKKKLELLQCKLPQKVWLKKKNVFRVKTASKPTFI